MMTSKRALRWPFVVALLALLGVAAALRLACLSSLPPGLHYDEAANVMLAAEIARGDKAPIFISSYTGKEVLFFYWAAAWMRLLGESVLALRLTAAVVGLCTVAAAAWAACELFHHRPDARWIGALTAAFLATSFWHLVFSRLGFRAITQPLLQALTVAALWRGLRLERGGWLALAGVLGGATLYTYLAARLFPLPVGLALLALLAAEQRGRRLRRLGQIALFAAAAAVTAAPLIAYFVAHPAALTTRVGQVAASSWAEAWAGIRACLAAFFLRGDPYIRFNIPYRPLLEPVTALLFLIGLGLVLAWPFRLARGRSPGAGKEEILPLVSAVFLLAVLPVMILPSALATGEITPSNLRLIGLLPFVYVFPALVLVESVRVARHKLHASPQSHACDLLLASLLLLLLLATAPFAATRYFRDWASSPALYESADGDMVDVARYLNERNLAGVTPYVASIHYRHPTIALLAREYSRIKWLTGGETLVVPAAGDALLILPRSAARGRAWIEALIPAPQLLAAPPAPDGEPAFTAYRLIAGEAPQPEYPVDANFGPIRLLGHRLLETPRSGGTVEVLLYWHVQVAASPGDLLPALRLTDPWGGLWGSARPFHYPAEQWAPGEVIIDHITLPVAAGAPPGTYRLEVGFYAASDGSRLPLLDTTGAFSGIAASLPLTLTRAAAPPDPADLSIRRRLDLVSSAGLTLLGVNQDVETLHPGEPLYLTLFWRADAAPQPGLMVRLTLGEETLYRGAPVHGTYPTGEWTPGEVIADRYDPRLGRDAAVGTFPLLLALVDADGQAVLGPLEIGQVTVEATERTFAPPPMAHAVGVPLGGLFELLGYDLQPAAPAAGDRVTLTLHWRALAETDTAYTVLVHLLAPDGTMGAQGDGMPQGGGYPTSLWVPGEVVSDPHTFDLPASLPPGSYTLAVGMYLVESGERLSVPGRDDGLIVLQTIEIAP